MKTEYGKRIREAMSHAKLTQKGLVEKSKVGQSSISAAINRSTGSSYTALIAKACGVDAVWLTTGEGEMIPDGVQDTRGLSPMALLLAQSFDDLPSDRRVRVRVHNELTSILLSELTSDSSKLNEQPK
jgi:phage repressor protein C with HTH and peptisase S24 domain